MDLTRCHRVFQRLLNSLIIGNPTTTEFARHKLQPLTDTIHQAQKLEEQDLENEYRIRTRT